MNTVRTLSTSNMENFHLNGKSNTNGNSAADFFWYLLIFMVFATIYYYFAETNLMVI